MNVLIVGSGKGSWEMRGRQLGIALGARVTSAPQDADWSWADVVVLVKRAAFTYATRARASGRPVIWDAIDFWAQPADNGRSPAQAQQLLDQALATIRPTLTIGATEAMATAAGGVCLPHHGILGLIPAATRDVVQAVGYDGNASYLHQWAPVLQELCAARGWRFVVNPPQLTDVDLLVALRGGPWDGWMPREWKSGVKVANAILAGRPVITQDIASVRELAPCGTVIETAAELEAALDAWSDSAARAAVVTACRERAPAFTVEALAARYRDILADVVEAA